jgi:hypothetical protein
MKDLIIKIVMMLIPMILSVLKDTLSNENFIKFADKLFDFAEDKISQEPDPYDTWLLELINIVRVALGVPDLPDNE